MPAFFNAGGEGGRPARAEHFLPAPTELPDADLGGGTGCEELFEDHQAPIGDYGDVDAPGERGLESMQDGGGGEVGG